MIPGPNLVRKFSNRIPSDFYFILTLTLNGEKNLPNFEVDFKSAMTQIMLHFHQLYFDVDFELGKNGIEFYPIQESILSGNIIHEVTLANVFHHLSPVYSNCIGSVHNCITNLMLGAY